MARGRSSKPLELVKGHRTKAEKEIRKEAESKLYTGISFSENKEVKSNKIAHREFLRIRKLLRAIGKDDDLGGQIINTHCLLVAECEETNTIKEEFIKTLENFEDLATDSDMSFPEKMDVRMKLQANILKCDDVVMKKRKMLLDIAKESLFTLASQLRSIPKKPEKPEEIDPMESLIGGG